MTTSGANFPEQYNAQEMVRADNSDDINTLIATHLNLLGERLKEISRNIENVRFNASVSIRTSYSKPSVGIMNHHYSTNVNLVCFERPNA